MRFTQKLPQDLRKKTPQNLRKKIRRKNYYEVYAKITVRFTQKIRYLRKNYHEI